MDKAINLPGIPQSTNQPKKKSRLPMKFLMKRKMKLMEDTNAKKNYDDKEEVVVAVRDHLETI